MNIQMKGGTAEVLLYEDIGGWFGITADQFIREIKSLKNITTINLRINSNGGNVFDGVAIYNYLKSHPARVEVDVDGLAASIASIIAMAGDERRMADNAWMMIHDPWIVAAGTSGDLRSIAETLDGVRATLLDTYMKHATASRDDISAMMAAETWLTAAQAKDAGLISAITGDMKIAASVRDGWFRNPPDQLKAEESKPPRNKRVAEISARMGMTLRRFKL